MPKKKKPLARRQSRRLVVMLTDKEHEALKNIAADRDGGMSALMREKVREIVAQDARL